MIDGSTLLLIPAGEFLMGTTAEEASQMVAQYGWRQDRCYDESPGHVVYLDTFSICRYPVTVAQYARYLEATAAPIPDCWGDLRFMAPDQPVIGVSRSEAIAYAAWAGLRLPTEAEWEKAARGADGRRWPWGNNWDPARLNSAESGIGHPTPVDQYAAAGNISPYGVCDMAGNVWEWCLDRYQTDYYADSPPENPRCNRPEIHYDAHYVLRGGSWYSPGERARCTARYDRFDAKRRRHIGFRCAKDGA